METLVVTLKDKIEMQLVSDILKKMRINVKQLTKEELEDLGLSKMMKQTNRSPLPLVCNEGWAASHL
jgi:hypothetical protein